MSFDLNAFMQNPNYFNNVAGTTTPNAMNMFQGMGTPQSMQMPAYDPTGFFTKANLNQGMQQGLGVNNGGQNALNWGQQNMGLAAAPQGGNWFSNAMGDMTMGDLGNAALGMFGAYTGYQQMQEASRRNDIAQGQLDLSRDQWNEKLRFNQAIAEQNKGA